MALAPDFLQTYRPPYGVSETLSPQVRHVLARNPGPFTFLGTATFIIGHGKVAVIDPGPDDAEHLEALRNALAGEEVTHILVTHGHLDHVGLLEDFATATGAEVFGFEHGTKLNDGDVIKGDNWAVEAIHTPGHASNHICFALPEENTIFTGDHIMGWSTTVIVPPDGNMNDYIAGLEKIAARPENRYRPTHGPAVEEGQRYANHLVAYRRRRTKDVFQGIADGSNTEALLMPILYPQVLPGVELAARATLRAHIEALEQDGKIRKEGEFLRII